jgi:DNA invertase Pin-like site-specific DNA recombinase
VGASEEETAFSVVAYSDMLIVWLGWWGRQGKVGVARNMWRKRRAEKKERTREGRAEKKQKPQTPGPSKAELRDGKNGDESASEIDNSYIAIRYMFKEVPNRVIKLVNGLGVVFTDE